MADQIIARYDKFRVVARPPVTLLGDTIFVQGWAGTRWVDLQSFNAISDDFAYTHAHEAARARAEQNERPEAPR